MGGVIRRHPLVCNYLLTVSATFTSNHKIPYLKMWVVPEVGSDWSVRAACSPTPAHPPGIYNHHFMDIFTQNWNQSDKMNMKGYCLNFFTCDLDLNCELNGLHSVLTGRHFLVFLHPPLTAPAGQMIECSDHLLFRQWFASSGGKR